MSKALWSNPPVWWNVNLWQKHAGKPSFQTIKLHTRTKSRRKHPQIRTKQQRKHACESKRIDSTCLKRHAIALWWCMAKKNNIKQNLCVGWYEKETPCFAMPNTHETSVALMLALKRNNSVATLKVEDQCENPTTRHYKYLHKVRSALLASARNKKPKNTRKPRQTWQRLFSQPPRRKHAGNVTCYHLGSSAQLLVLLRCE